MKITIRKATLSDLETLEAFQQGVVVAELPFNPTLKKDNVQYYDIEKLITSSESELLVAEVGHQLIGSGYARIEKAKPYFKHEHHGYLGFMFVSPTHRRKGVNKMILEGLKNWCLSRGINELRLDVYSDNVAAIKAYEKVGFKSLLTEMRLRIGD